MDGSITTKRLILREIEESDAPEIVRWRSDEGVFRFFKSPHKITIEEHLNWFKNIYPNNPYRLDYMCIEKASGTKIGVFGLIKNSSTAEVNYLLSPNAQHKGYAKEAIEALIQYASDNWKVDRAIAEIHRDNEPSIRLVQKMGFEPVSQDEMFTIYGKSIG